MLIDYLSCHLQEIMQGITGILFQISFVPNIEIKGFNVLIDGKNFFDLPVKKEEETYKKIIKMSNNNDYTTDNLIDFAYFKKITN